MDANKIPGQMPGANPPTMPAQNAQTLPVQPPNPPQALPPKSNSDLKILWTALGMFIFGVVGGFLLFKTYPLSENKPAAVKPESAPTPAQMTIPEGATKIQDCVDNKGALYAKDSDLPGGPIYMVNENKVIGIEYKLPGVEDNEEKDTKTFGAFKMQIDHVAISTQSAETSINPYLDLYFVDEPTAQEIKCEVNLNFMENATGSAEASGMSKTSPAPEISGADTISPEESSPVQTSTPATQ